MGNITGRDASKSDIPVCIHLDNTVMTGGGYVSVYVVVHKVCSSVVCCSNTAVVHNQARCAEYFESTKFKDEDEKSKEVKSKKDKAGNGGSTIHSMQKSLFNQTARYN
jgi:hypothetical protein